MRKKGHFVKTLIMSQGCVFEGKFATIDIYMYVCMHVCVEGFTTITGYSFHSPPYEALANHLLIYSNNSPYISSYLEIYTI